MDMAQIPRDFRRVIIAAAMVNVIESGRGALTDPIIDRQPVTRARLLRRDHAAGQQLLEHGSAPRVPETPRLLLAEFDGGLARFRVALAALGVPASSTEAAVAGHGADGIALDFRNR
jgi:hypothetical protein